ncbi:MAG: hypothetical protein HYX60_09365 [Legionella longbeachae]|nr:hypothetical protein [Legionella longbeachae]
MNSDEYIALQETNKKIFELSQQEEKEKILTKMIEDEINFILKNIPPMTEKVEDQLLNFNIIPETNQETSPIKNKSTLYERIEKITPHNFFERGRVTDLNGQPADDEMKELLEKDPELMQKLCDMVNEYLKMQAMEAYENNPGYKISDNADFIEIKRTPQSIQNKDLEVENVVNRAHKFKESKSQIELSPIDNSKNSQVERHEKEIAPDLPSEQPLRHNR